MSCGGADTMEEIEPSTSGCRYAGVRLLL